MRSDVQTHCEHIQQLFFRRTQHISTYIYLWL